MTLEEYQLLTPDQKKEVSDKEVAELKKALEKRTKGLKEYRRNVENRGGVIGILYDIEQKIAEISKNGQKTQK